MLTHSARLGELAAALRSDRLDVVAYVNEVCDHIEAVEPQVQALLPEPDRRSRLNREAAALRERFPDPTDRPPLYGILIGVKDIFRADGFPTKAGSQLPPELFDGPEASSVTALRDAGALVLGKTVTTEFAYFAPGPTRNPHNLDHTPGGSSSGSAAAVAAGLCPLAFGTQTIGSVIRPAAYCGVVGYKPSFGRIAIDGVIPFSVSADHVGLFTQDVEGMTLAASLLCHDWQSDSEHGASDTLPVLGVPEGPYLAQASSEGLEALDAQLAALEAAGYTVLRVPALEDIADVNQRHRQMIAAEFALVHAEWFAEHESQYRPSTAELIRDGQAVSVGALAEARLGRARLREELARLMEDHEIDVWVSPPAPGPAPMGIESTGDPTMNLPWTHAGLPTVSLPAGQAENGLPLGLQCTSSFMTDERLLAWAGPLAQVLAEL